MDHHDTVAMAEALCQLRMRVEAWTEAAIEDQRDRSEWIVKDCARLATQGPHAYLAHVQAQYDSHVRTAISLELEAIFGEA